MDFTPTFLYIKQHRETGLKYFGKTIKFPPVYIGSGEYWLDHLKKHGRNIETVWFQLFTDRDMLVETALKFSSENNIVISLEWANEKPENGLDGALPGESHHFFGVTGESHPRFNTTHTDVAKEKMRKPHPTICGENHPLWKVGHTEKTKEKMKKNHADISGANNPMFGKKRKRIECPHCGELFVDSWINGHIKKEH